MDMYCSDKKLSELTDSPLGDFLDNDVFTPPVSTPMDHFGIDNSAMDSDWLENFFDDPVLNDRMISDALQPNVQSEHSYSLATSNDDQTLDLSISSSHSSNLHKDLDMDLTAVNPNHMSLTTGQTTIFTGNQLIRQAAISSQIADTYIKQEPLDLSLDTEMTTVTVTRSTNPQTLLKQPTIILATSQQQQQQQQHMLYNSIKQERLVLPKVEFKMEPQHQMQQNSHHQQQQQQQQQRYTHSIMSSPEHSTESFDNLSLPPTPPSSNNSDSDGCDRSPPCSPHRSSRHRPSSPLIQQPFFMSPIPTSGILVLSEEEKRTLISEGYPIPGKLPLTKQEEKNLKKIRRKIKNKISAQESRRKKKDYLETLERKVEAFSQDNVDLRKKVDNLQNNNQSLMSQLHKLQAVVRNFRPLSPSGTQTGTCLMVLVLCFAVMLGSWSPMSLRMGYSSSVSASPSSISHSSSVADLGFLPTTHKLQGLGVARQEPQVKDATTGAAAMAGTYGPYATPNMRSRVLLSLKEEEDEEFGPHAPFSYKWLLGGFFGGCSANDEPIIETMHESHEPMLPKVNVMDVEMEINQTGDIAAPSRQPDMAVTTSSKPINATA